MEVIKDDYIRKIEAVKILQKAYTEGRIKAKDGCVSVLDDINALPKADVQPVKHGKWIEQRHTPTNGYNYNVPYSTYVCSGCWLEIHNDEYSKYVRGTYTNCPVCTAKMDKGADDENSK